MPRPEKPTLSYLHHKPKNLAYVRLPDGNGGRKVVYLGEYNSPESRAEHARLLAKMATAPTPQAALRLVTNVESPADEVTVDEIIVGFMEHANQHYRRADGTVTDEVDQCKQTLRPLKKLYGDTLAVEFGPKDLKALRQVMIDAAWSRKTINHRIGRIKRVFRWAASEEMIPVSVYTALATVTGLQAGRTGARETEPVAPVPMEHILPVLPQLRPAVAAMIEVQLPTGMRPGEVCQLRPCDITRDGNVWLYRPSQFKTKHKGKSRVIAIGPKAQSLLAKFVPSDPADYYFSPRRVIAELRAELSAKRKTPRYSSHMKRNETKRLANPKRPAGEKYRVKVYEHSIAKGIEKANRPLIEAGVELEYHISRWGPNRLRHNHGTFVRHAYGLEAAQVALGHARADVTQVYAEKNLTVRSAMTSPRPTRCLRISGTERCWAYRSRPTRAMTSSPNS